MTPKTALPFLKFQVAYEHMFVYHHPMKSLHPLNDLVKGLNAIDPSSLGVTELADLRSATRQTEAALAALTARIAARANDLASAGEVDSASAFLTGRGEVSTRTARNEHRRSTTLGIMPALCDALIGGRVSPEQVDAVSRTLDKLPEAARPALVELDGELADHAARSSLSRFIRHLRALENTLAPPTDQAEPEHPASTIRLWFDEDGTGRLDGRFDPVQFDSICEMLDVERRSLAANGDRTMDHHLTAEALYELLCRGSGVLRPGQAARPSVTIILDHQTATSGPHDHSTCETVRGSTVPPETARRLCCDATLNLVAKGPDGTPLNVGRAARTATARQWIALRAIYRTCAWSDCDRPINWCHAHHIRHWEDGGPTDLGNLVPLCNHHHHQVHEGRWSITLHPNRQLDIRRPDGTPYASSLPDRESDDFDLAA